MELRGKRVLVTGADGFIGSHLVEHLLSGGAIVRAFCYYNSFNSRGWLEEVNSDNLEIYMGDIRDYHSVYEAVTGCTIIFHLAALIAIPYSYSAPSSYIDTNITGTLNILQSCKNLEVERVLVTSTSEVYGTANYVPIDEKHPRQGQSPYSASKIGADALSESFFRSFNLPVTTVRPFNTYGPRQSMRAVIPTIIAQLASGKEQLKLGDLTPTRDLVYVKDTVFGFSEIAKAESLIGEDVNIATDSEISIRDLVDMLIEIINPKAEVVSDESRLRPKKSEVFRLWGSNKKIKENTDWLINFPLKNGLKETVEWFADRENLKKYKSDDYVI